MARLAQFLSCHRQLLDGLLCVSKPLLHLANQSLPELPAPRIALIHYPVSNPIPSTAAPRPRPPGRTFTIGIAGRIQIEQKRLDRLPALLAQLQARNLDCQVECLGEGPDLPQIRKACAGFTNVRFLGRLDGDAYWQALASWDAILFLSDYEGLPIALLEAMSVGVIPVFPSIGCGADDYLKALDSQLLYQPGDLDDASAKIAWLDRCPPSSMAELRKQSQAIVQPHHEDRYFKTFSEFVQTVRALPRISVQDFPARRIHWTDHSPFGILSRFAPQASWRSPLS